MNENSYRLNKKYSNCTKSCPSPEFNLGELMNLQPGEPYELVKPKRTPPVSKIKDNLQELEQQALLNRPELRTVDYQKRINAKETKVAILELLPSLNVYLGENYDSNSFLFNNNWLSYGAKISWNLMNVFRHPTRLQVIDAQEEVLNTQSLALTMTVMTQVHVAVAQYEAALREVKIAQRYFATQLKIATHVQRAWSLNRLSEHRVIREKVQGLLAELRHEMALAKLEMAYANLLAAIGEDPFPANLSDEDLDELADGLKQRWESLEQHARVFTCEHGTIRRSVTAMIRKSFTLGMCVISLLFISGDMGFAKKGSLQSADLNAVRGVVKPTQEAVISSELQARVKQIPFRDGQTVQKRRPAC